jgi:Galactose oxidase-like, Early set domain
MGSRRVTTHADEMNARHVELAVTRTANGFTATAPTSAVAPPGYYMLFVLTPDRIPSVAKWVHVGP